MTLYRVLLYDAAARPRDPGGVLYVPPQREGRLDNEDLYRLLYVGEHAAGCVAEAFGRIPLWRESTFGGLPGSNRSVRALVTYDAYQKNFAVCDLDDARSLLARSLRPSDVVTRDYEFTRNWARAIYSEKRWAGIRWWSYYESRWANVGLWDFAGLKPVNIEPLHVDHAAVRDAAETLSRVIVQTSAPRPPTLQK